MPSLKPEDVISRSNAADQEKQNWVSQYRDAYEFALPMRNLYSTFQPGAEKMNRVFNSTPIISVQKFSSRLQANLTPSNQHWLDFLPGTDIREEDKEEALNLLQDVQKKFFGIIENSNFNTVITEYYLDLSVGTAAMIVQEGGDDNPVIFTAVPNAQLSLDEGPLSSIDGVFRQHTMAIRNIESTWSDLTTEGKAEINRLMNDTNNSKQGDGRSSHNNVNILEATYFDFKENVFWYQVILKGVQDNSNISQPNQVQNLDTGGAILLVERRLDESPWIITRWIKVAGEVFGRGPLLFALPDIKTLNKATELMLQNASIAISGLWKVANDSIANLDMVELSAGTFLPLDNINDLERLDTPGDFRIGEAIVEKLENNIRATLFDRSLPDPTGSVRSPTEIIERVRELAQDIGAPFARINSEMLKPLASRVLNIMTRRGIVEFPIKLNGRAVKVVPTSPLAREQNINDLESAVKWLQIIQSIGPEVLFGTIKVEDFAEWSAEKLGVDKKLARDKGERSKLQEEIAQLITSAQQGEGRASSSPGTSKSVA